MIELARRRSDLFTASSISRLAEMNSLNQLRHRYNLASWLDAQMSGIKAFPFGHHCPKNACILVGHCHGRLLPTRLFTQLMQPL